jgi:hypothetical protein
MNWPIVWSHEAEADLFLIHFETIHAIAGAVRVWAETGGGHTELVDGDRIRVLAPGGAAVVMVDVAKGAIVVLRVVADTPLPFMIPLLDEPDNGDDD